MQIKHGILLVSPPEEGDPLFEKAVVYIAEYNEKGALGFVINKLFPRTFNELVEFKQSKPLLLYQGGPIADEALFFIHRRPDIINGGTVISGNIFLGGDFKAAVQAADKNNITATELQLFIGYCGWDPGQLEKEIAEGCWIVKDNGNDYLFTHPNIISWQNMLPNSAS